jgi:tetratricopeptide (TPR) repeat protein
VLALMALVAAAAALGPAYLSTRYEERAARTWTADAGAALRDLDRAADLNPLSSRPLLRAGTLAVDLGRLGAARRYFERSLEREDTWYARFELALIASSEGRQREARRQIAIARALNREDLLVSDAARRIRDNRRAGPRAFNRQITEMNRDRFTRPRN